VFNDSSPFPGYEPNREHMLRVIRNHRRAAYGESTGYEGLTILPVPLPAKECPDQRLIAAARKAWDDALELGVVVEDAVAAALADPAADALVLADAATLGETEALALALGDSLSVEEAEGEPEALSEAEPDGDAQMLADAVPDALSEAVADAEALTLGVTDGVGVAAADAEAVKEGAAKKKFARPADTLDLKQVVGEMPVTLVMAT
jgi:hypothetical protein